MAVLLEAFHATLLSATERRIGFYNASAEAQCGRSVPLIDGYTHKCISRLTVFSRIVENMLCEITHKIAVLCFKLIDRRADSCVFRRRDERPFTLQGAIAEERRVAVRRETAAIYLFNREIIVMLFGLRIERPTRRSYAFHVSLEKRFRAFRGTLCADL